MKRPDDVPGVRIKGSRSMIKAVKGTRDILPPSSTAWNQVEAICARGLSSIQLPGDPHAYSGRDGSICARRRRGDRHRQQRDVHIRRPRRQFAYAAAGSHRVGDARLHRTSSGPDSRPAKAVLHRPDVPARAAAKRPLPAVLSDRRGGDRIGIARRGCRSDRDGGGVAASRGTERDSSSI